MSDFIFIDGFDVFAINPEFIVCVTEHRVYTTNGLEIPIMESTAKKLGLELHQLKISEMLKLKKQNQLLRVDIETLNNKLQEQFNLEPDSHSAELEAARSRFLANVATVDVSKVQNP